MPARRVYLDNSATTPVDPRVAAAMARAVVENFGNASSVHGFGQQARAAVDRARREVAALIGAKQNEIVFTSGGTEANNLAIRGVVRSSGDSWPAHHYVGDRASVSRRRLCGVGKARLGSHAAARLSKTGS